MNMVEKVAQAIEAIVNSKHEYDGIEYAELARAAIEAMMEPTEEMVAAGRPGVIIALRSVDSIYQAMITAALEE